MARKRDLAYHQQELMIDQPYHPPGGVQNSSDYWNAKAWNWDCTRFVAQPVDANAMSLDTPVQSVQSLRKSNQLVAEDDGSLSLKLGSGSGGSSFNDEPALRPSKRVAGSYTGSGSMIPGGIGNANHPTCQVDSCMVVLSNAKDYHRRHKVCEFHSKTTQALVEKQMQRFCQQCSRFHVLSEFDEGKRSCRRRLAGHNRRRRKAQPDEVTPQLLATGGQQNAVHTGLDLVGLLAALTGSQGNGDNVNGSPVVVPNKEQLIQLISKIGSFPSPTEANTKLPETDNFNKTASKASPEHLSGSSGNSSSQSTLNLFGDPPHASQVSVPDHDLFTIPSQRSGRSSDSERTKSASTYQLDPFNARKRTNLDLAFTGREKSSNICHSPEEYSISQVHYTQGKLPLQLFCSSPEDNNSPPNMENSSKYFSSDSSNQNEDRSPLSSPGVELFPVKSSKHIVNHERIPHAVNAKPPAGKTPRGAMSFDLFGGSNKGVEVDLFQRSTDQAGHTSPGSDVSPSSSTCCAQDLTRRILIKLFGKNPNHLPEALRSEMFTWLSNTPSQMESYIRPGCVILSIYVSMPSASWEQLDQNLLEYASWLLQRTNIDIWKDGRFLIQTGKQLVSHNNGKLRLCKSWITPKAPELISVSPLAIVGGHETRICLTGRNLNFGTKIHCTFMGGYITKELSDATVQNSTFNRTTLCSCEIHLDAPSGTGRYFIEVENGFKGNCFPIIIADSSICKELRQLEFELEADRKLSDTMPDEKESDGSWPKAEILHFLNELGWLFQMKRGPSNTLEYSVQRFKFLLTFSVERDFAVLVKKLLDILVEEKMGDNGIPTEISEMGSAVQLLHCAVKRKCRKMVDMLINYSLVISDPEPSKIHVFLPNIAGPGGLTPLHIAACTSGSEDLVDALTNDPLELGLSCWTSQLDASGQSPYAYATSRNNHSYNRLVARKLADRINNQISLSVDETETMEQTFVNSSPTTSHNSKHKAVSCSQCAVAAARCSRRKVPGSHGMVARPFILSMLAIAAVCVCVCLYFRGHPYTGMDSPFTWERLDYRTI